MNTQDKYIHRQTHGNSHIDKSHSSYPIKQIYCWIKSNDNTIIIVSKDGENRQFPGGKPKHQETHMQTLHREVLEETSLNLETQINNIHFFGYYLIEEKNLKYLQIRYRLDIDINSKELKLSPNEKPTEKGKIQFIQSVRLNEITKYMTWLYKSPELSTYQEKA